MTRQLSRAELLAQMSRADREVFLMGLTRQEMSALRWDWHFWARPQQIAPPGDWSVWMAVAGRGFGKTRLGAEWVRHMVCGPTPMAAGQARRIALVAETAADARHVMVMGESGILAVHPPEFRPHYSKSERTLTWPNGAIAQTFSAEEPDQLRGPEHDLAWSDELAKWRYAQDTWDMLQFGLRIGDPKQLVTTTPRPIPIVRELLAGQKSGDVVVTHGSTFDNTANLSPKYIRRMRDKYEGTRLGRQELNAEVLEDVPGALWTRLMLDTRSESNPLGAGMRIGEQLPRMRRVVVGVDPSGSSGEEDSSDSIGIVAAGQGEDGIYYVLADTTCALGPSGWGRRVVDTFDRFEADLVVGEQNYGGAMVEHTIRTVSRRISYRSVHAARGKHVRAEPIAALYEQGRVRHVGRRHEFEGESGRREEIGGLAALEDQMCSMTRHGYEGSGSPDRVDAAVWALTELAFGRSTEASSGELEGLY